MNTVRTERILDRMETRHVHERRVLSALWRSTSEGINGPRPFWKRWILRWAFNQLVPVWLWNQVPCGSDPSFKPPYLEGGASTKGLAKDEVYDRVFHP